MIGLLRRRLRQRRLQIVISFCSTGPAAICFLMLALVLFFQGRSTLAVTDAAIRERSDHVRRTLGTPQILMALTNPASFNSLKTSLHGPLVVPVSSLSIASPEVLNESLLGYGCGVLGADGSTFCVTVGRDHVESLSTIYITGSFIAPSLYRVAPKRAMRTKEKAERPQYWVASNEEADTFYLGIHRAGERDPIDFVLPAKIPVYKDGTFEDRVTIAMFRNLLSPNSEPGTRATIHQSECEKSELDPNTCPRRTAFAIALPRKSWDTAFHETPDRVSHRNLPTELLISVRVEGKRSFGDRAILFESSNRPSSTASRKEIEDSLSSGERLEVIYKHTSHENIVFEGVKSGPIENIGWIGKMGIWLLAQTLSWTGRELNSGDPKIQKLELGIPRDDVEVHFLPAPPRIDPQLAVPVGYAFIAMLVGLLIALISFGLMHVLVIRRAASLTQRARAVTRAMQSNPDAMDVEFSDLTNHRDELGVLARTMQRLVARVKADIAATEERAEKTIERQRQRAEFEINRNIQVTESGTLVYRKMAHDMLSPLAELVSRQNDDIDLMRMHRAVQFFKGIQIPVELKSADVVMWIRKYVERKEKRFAGIEFKTRIPSLDALFDEAALPDALDHIVNNALRFRHEGSLIIITLVEAPLEAIIRIDNQGPKILDNPIERIFDPNITNNNAAHRNDGNLGQGLYMARYWLGRIGGVVLAENLCDGVRFEVRLRRPK